MENGFYAGIGFAVIWCMKYIFIPIGVAVFARVIADRLLRPQRTNKRKNGLTKTVPSKNPSR